MADGRVHNSIRNIIYRITSQVVTILLKFVSRSVFIYVLGVEYLGINGLFSEILQVLALADLGFGTAMVFSMYRPLAQKDHKKLAQLVQLYKKIYTVIATAITCIGLLLTPFLKYLINMDAEIPNLYLYYVLYLANTVSSYLVVYKTCILNADQKNYLISKYNVVFGILSMILCSAVLLLTRNFAVYLVVQVAMTFVNNFYQSHVADKLYPYINEKTEPLPKEERNGIFNNIKSVFVYKLARTLVGSTDNTLISILVGTAVVGYYSNYSMVVSNTSMIINIVFSSITASIGNLIIEKNTEKNYSVYKTIQFFSYVLSIIAVVGTYTLINDFIIVWLGKEFVLDPLVVAAISINMYFSVVLMPIWSYREATGLYQQTKYVMVATAIVNLGLSIALGKAIGLAGILFATSIARISTYFWYEPKILFEQFFEKRVTGYYLSILNNVLSLVVVGCFTVFVFHSWNVTGWLDFFIKTCAVGVVATIGAVVCYCRDPQLKHFSAVVKNVIRREKS